MHTHHAVALVVATLIPVTTFASPAAENCQGDQGVVLDVETDAGPLAQAGASFNVWTVTSKNPGRACNTRGFVLVDDLGELDPIAIEALPVGSATVNQGDFTQVWEVTLPADAPIGRFSLEYAVPDGSGEDAAADLWVGFDSPDDTDPALLADAVVSLKIGQTTSTFAFDTESPEVKDFAALVLADLSADERRSPEAVVRALRAALYDGGDKVLWGRWDGKAIDGNVSGGRWDAEGDGREPWSWSGASAILRTSARARYGQCWVFAGTLTSLARSVGIPSRVVTNLNSAHESGDPSLEFEGAYRPARPGDLHLPFGSAPNKSPSSVWNFHVWVESMLVDTWNAVDPAPLDFTVGIEPLCWLFEGCYAYGFTSAAETFPMRIGAPAGTPAGVIQTKAGPIPFGG